ncbi:S66 peptidase family protein [Tenacibaculum amylolyticum]|uniref:S66 peptidase family protein n=1 Tax=Tenacibaculum amylolyticum TaxID=104269 RepID=UPI003894F22B
MKRLFIVVLSLVLLSVNAQENMNLVTPPYLQKGDTIAIVAPAGILKNRKHVIDAAKELAESWGLHVIIGKHVFTQAHHFAGTDAQRCQDFQEALDNPKIKAIWSARGGYGSVRILDKLDFTKFKKQPKWVIGYSDITAFHNHIHNLGVATLHAMMGTSMQDKPEDIPETIETFRKALFGEELVYTIRSSNYNRVGEAEGVLVGGNIAILASMLGSDSQMNTDGKILFIEEIGEYKYAIDRMLQSLKRAGYFRKVKAVIVGDMTKVRKNTTPWGSSIEQLILDIVPKDIPVLFDFPAGHEPDNRALLMGKNILLKVGNKESSVVFE